MTVSIADRVVGGGRPTYVIAEIGLNHNGDVEIAKQLIDVARAAGADAVKFQKRTPEIATPEHMRDVQRETPWGTMSYLDYRRRVEFGRDEYVEIGDYATMAGLHWFASPWDVPSVEFMENLGAVTHKVASASVTDLELLRALAEMGLGGLETLPAKVLSQGQRRRVGLARLLLTRARLWILDEPYTALDSAAVGLLQTVIRRHLAQGGLVVLTTHQQVTIETGTIKQLRLGTN